MAYNSLGQIIQQSVDPKNLDYNSMGKYGAFVKSFGDSFTKLKTDTDKLNTEVEDFRQTDALDNKIIDNPIEGKQNVKNISDVIINTENLISDDIEQLKRGYKDIKLTSNEKQRTNEAIKELENTYLIRKKQLNEGIETFNSKANALYDFLISRKGSYTREDGKINFTTQQDIDKCNQLASAAQSALENVK